MITSSRRGISIAVALLVLSVISVIGLAIAAIRTQNLALANADRNNERARYAAEAGIAAAEAELIASTGWNTGFQTTALASDSDAAYSVAVVNNSAGTAAVSSGDTSIPMGMVYVVSTGSVNGKPLQRIGCLLAVGNSPIFKYAAFGLNAVSLGGTSAIEDSFSSSAGPYSTTNQAQSGADVGTNSVTGNAVSYSGQAENFGGVAIGPGGNPATVVDGSLGTNFTSPPQAMTEPFYVPVPNPNLVPGTQDISYSAHTTATLQPGAYHDLNVATHCDITLAPGTYYFSGDVDWGSGSSIILPSSGVVKIYVAGTWDSGGGTIVNKSNIPQNFQLYGTASCTAVTINGGNDAYLVVDAPTATVIVQGNSAVYGAVIGNTVNVQGSAAIHYDRDLQKSPLTRPAFFRRAWKKV
jgi:hypothetical protein